MQVMALTLDEAKSRSPLFREWWDTMQGREGCWEWTGSIRGNGYGQVTLRPKNWFVHRLVYALVKGPLDPSLTIDHLCRNRRCANPAHLEQVTSLVNTMRGDTPARRNAARTHCAKGHEFTPENTYWRDDQRRIRQCRACAIEKASGRNQRKRDVLSARHMSRYHSDPEYRARKQAIQRAYTARRRATAA